MKKIILITGGSRGIGAATALEAAKEGYQIGINYKNDDNAAESIVNKINRAGGKAIPIKADVSKEHEVIALFEEVEKRLGKISALVNNAGIADEQKTLSEMTAERIEKMFKTNVLGTFLCSREAVKRMAVKHNGKGGAIVNISSGASKSGSPFEYIDYAATKGAIDTFTIGLAKEVAGEGIRVNAIRPGFIETDIHKTISSTVNRLENVVKIVPMKRIGQPVEIAKTILWLLSENSSYTTGAIIDIAGGK